MNFLLSMAIAFLWWGAFVAFLKYRFSPSVNRLFLLAGLLFSAMPFIDIWPSWNAFEIPVVELPEIALGAAQTVQMNPESAHSFSWMDALLLISALLVLRFLITWFLAFRLASRFKRTAEPDARGFFRIAPHQPAFTFGWWIFLPKQLSGSEEALILAHEQAHVHHHHYLDRWLGEIYRCLFWWNPASHMQLSLLYAVHEHQADHSAHSGRTEEYAALLLKQVLAPAHQQLNLAFFPSYTNLKSRIAMMTKNTPFQSPKRALVVAAAMSFSTFLLLAACNKPEQLEIEEAPKVLSIMELDQVPGFAACANEPDSMAFNCFTMQLATHIAQTFKYPESARAAKAEGRIFAEFVLDETGDVAEVTIKRSGRTAEDTPEISAAWDALEAEVISTINALPELEPAQKDGQAVGVRYIIPINCQLN